MGSTHCGNGGLFRGGLGDAAHPAAGAAALAGDLSDQGNATAAEAAASWGHDLLSSTFPDEYGRGVAAYDLGCFYAKHGRADEAIPYLRKGIELRPAELVSLLS